MGSQLSRCSYQSTDEAGVLLSRFLDLLVGGARLVSGQVFLLERKKKGHLLKFFQKWVVEGIGKTCGSQPWSLKRARGDGCSLQRSDFFYDYRLC